MALQRSVVYPFGPSASTCGYCSPSGRRSEQNTSLTEGSLVAYCLTCDVYQNMIDRGWRRSGTYCYKPDLKSSCCPQYPIRLDALSFSPTKRQRKIIRRWNEFVVRGVGGESVKPKQGPPETSTFGFLEAIHGPERAYLGELKAAHNFEVTLEPSTYTDEKFALFQSYEANIHKELERHPGSFKRFLIESPLLREPIRYSAPPASHLPLHYGSYHQLYRLDGRLIAMGVIDILPSCVSSVYFMWEKEYEKYSLGKLSALREVSLAREIHEAGVPDMRYLYMGYYIHSCQKMRYKGDYKPSYLADPEDFAWHRLEDCIPLLDENRYASFTYPEHSILNSEALPARSHRATITGNEQSVDLLIKTLGNSLASKISFR